MKNKTIVLLLVVLLISFFGCSKPDNSSEKDYLFSNLVGDIQINYYRDNYSNNLVPVMLVSSKELGDIKVSLLDKNNHEVYLNVESKMIENVTESNYITMNNNGVNWSEIEELYDKIELEKDQNKSIQLNSELDFLISESTEKESPRNVLSMSYVYMLSAYLNMDELFWGTEYSEILIYSDDNLIMRKSVKITAHENSDVSEKLFPLVAARALYEINASNDISFDFAYIFKANDSIKIESISLDNTSMNANSIYLRVKKGNTISTYTESIDNISSLDIQLDEGDLITIVPSIFKENDVEDNYSPFFYGNINIVINEDTDNIKADSGIISTTTDPYVYYYSLVENKEVDEMLRFQEKIHIIDEKSIYISLEV